MATAKKSSSKAKPASGKSATKKRSPAKKAAAKKVATKRAAAKKVVAKKAPTKTAPPVKPAKKPASKKRAAPAKESAPAKKPKSKLDKKFLNEMKSLLAEERARYVHSAEVLKEEADSLMEDREPGDVQFDEESGEGDTLAVERERDLALSAQARAAVDQIDDALERIKAGTYGICIQSGLQIPKERLRAIPWCLERVEYKAGGLGRRR